MKRKIFFLLGVLLVLGFVSFPCFAQSSNEVQKFVGTWTQQGVSGDYATWRFLADGTGAYGYNDFFYALIGSGKIVITTRGSSASSWEYYFVDGGTTLVLYSPGGINGMILKKSN